MSRAAYVASGILIVLTVLVVYYASKTLVPSGQCVQSVKCPDKWRNVDNTPIAAMKECVNETFVTPGYGPGLCTNPCKPGQTPCWDSVTNQGTCYPGTGFVCPCDAKSCGDGGTCVDGVCHCKPGWSGPTCAVKGGAPCDAAGGCGSHGHCVTDNGLGPGYCVCDPGWTNNRASGAPCSTCAPGWGPEVGSTDYAPANYCKGMRYSGVTVPVPIGCTTGNNPDFQCKSYFGPSFSATSTDHTFCASCGGSINDTVVGCSGKDGNVWASPMFDAAGYNPWAAHDCELALPAGFVAPLSG